MAYNVNFLRGTAESYKALATRSVDTFYFTTDDNNLYLGDVKLSNGADLAKEVLRIAQNERDIEAIEEQLQDLIGSGAGSIQDMIDASIKVAKEALELKITANEDAIKAINDETNGILALAKKDAESKVKALAEGAVKTNADDIDALETRATNLETTVNKLDGADTVEGSVKAQLKAVKTELEGKIVDSMYDDTDVKKSIADNAAAAKNAQDEVDALEIVVANNATDAKVTLATAATATEGYLKTYVITQGTTEVGKIDIPKELVVTGGEVVVNPDGKPAGTYIKLTIANQEAPIFINVKDLVDVYTAAQGATQVQLTISETNEISAVIVAGSIGTTELTDASVTAAKLADNAKALFDEAGAAADAETAAKGHADSLNTAMDKRVKELEDAVGEGGSVETQITTAIEGLDANVTSAAVDAGKGLQVNVVEADGKVTAVNVTGNFDAAYDALGAATTAKSEAIADAATKANTAETNAKAHADSLNTAMDTRMKVVEAASTDAVKEVVSGTDNGTIKVDGENVAVTGLGTAAYANSSAFDINGSAATAEANAKKYVDDALTWGSF